jgi:hypothetical protein
MPQSTSRLTPIVTIAPTATSQGASGIRRGRLRAGPSSGPDGGPAARRMRSTLCDCASSAVRVSALSCFVATSRPRAAAASVSSVRSAPATSAGVGASAGSPAPPAVDSTPARSRTSAASVAWIERRRSSSPSRPPVVTPSG